MWGFNKDNPFVLVPKTYFNFNFTEFYMISHEIQVRVYTHYCYLQAYEISNDLEVELHDYVHIFMHIAEISRF